MLMLRLVFLPVVEGTHVLHEQLLTESIASGHGQTLPYYHRIRSPVSIVTRISILQWTQTLTLG